MKLNIKQKLKDNKIKLIVMAILFAFLVLSFFFSSCIENALGLVNKKFTNQITKNEMERSSFAVNYIDVGQGNSTYIHLPDGKVLLIDGGDVNYGNKVAKLLRDDRIDKIDYLIATHADSDHIAGLNFILKEFEVKNIFRPFQIAGTGTNYDTFEVFEDEDLGDFYNYIQEITNNRSKISRITTDTYKSFISNIYNEYYEEEGVYYHSNIIVFYDGLKIVGENYSIEFFAPLVQEDNYDLSLFSNTSGYATVGYGVNNSNDNSAIILIKIFNNTFLFTGDASWTNNLFEEEASESHEEIDFINSLTDEEKLKFKDLSVFLLGHHGSSFSSSDEILELTNSKFFVISVEDNSSYDHPAEVVLAKIASFKKSDDYLLMTKNCGTITFGEVENKLCYTLDSYEKNNNFTISWWLLSTVLYIFVTITIFSLKTSKSNN